MVEDKTISGTFQVDGSNFKVVDETVPDGELWYFDAVNLTADGTGSNEFVQIDGGIGVSKSFIDSVDPQLNVLGRGFRKNIDTDFSDGDGFSVELGSYATGGEVFRFRAPEINDGTTFAYSVSIRRIL